MGLRIRVVVSFCSNQINYDQVVQCRKESFSSLDIILLESCPAQKKWIMNVMIVCFSSFSVKNGKKENSNNQDPR